MKLLSAFIFMVWVGGAYAETCTETTLLGFQALAQKNMTLAVIAQKQAGYYEVMAQRQGGEDSFFVANARKAQGIASIATKTYEYASSCYNDKLRKINNFLNQ